MPFALTDLTALATAPFDTIIDVRSEAEYAEDHIPGAINLPVLNNEQRDIVGTIYVQDSRFKARKLGAALVARNSAHHLETALKDKDSKWRPLVYCWRGGQRSSSFTTILRQVGWQAETIDGGYKAYRRLVKTLLYDTPFSGRILLLDGNTGSAKTDILLRLPGLGVQIIDLEGLAHHRGSLFGARPEGQPSQKAFESALAQKLIRLDTSRPVVIEAESAKIGNLIIPPALWAAMRAAPRLEIRAPLQARARYLTRAYGDIIEDSARLRDILNKLRPYQPKERIAHWLELADAGHMQTLAAELMSHHYDSRYSKARDRSDRITPLATKGLAARDLDKLARHIAELVASI